MLSEDVQERLNGACDNLETELDTVARRVKAIRQGRVEMDDDAHAETVIEEMDKLVGTLSDIQF